MFFIELLEEMLGPFDRTRNQLREKAGINRKYAEVPFRFQLAMEDIHHIADLLESVEGDSDRQQYVEEGNIEFQTEALAQRAHAGVDEIEILKGEKHRQQDGDAGPQEGLSAFGTGNLLQPEARAVGNTGGNHHQ